MNELTSFCSVFKLNFSGTSLWYIIDIVLPFLGKSGELRPFIDPLTSLNCNPLYCYFLKLM